MSSLNADLVNDVQRIAIEVCLDLALETAAAIEGVGDHTLSREQRIQQFMARAQSGALDVMKDLRPDLYQRTVKQYLDDIKASPLVGQPDTIARMPAGVSIAHPETALDFGMLGAGVP